MILQIAYPFSSYLLEVPRNILTATSEVLSCRGRLRYDVPASSQVAPTSQLPQGSRPYATRAPRLSHSFSSRLVRGPNTLHPLEAGIQDPCPNGADIDPTKAVPITIARPAEKWRIRHLRSLTTGWAGAMAPEPETRLVGCSRLSFRR